MSSSVLCHRANSCQLHGHMAHTQESCGHTIRRTSRWQVSVPRLELQQSIPRSSGDCIDWKVPQTSDFLVLEAAS